MFFAICKSTDEKVNSLTIETNPKYQFIDEETFYADPDEIESCPPEIDIQKIEVRFRKGKQDVVNWNGTQYDMSPCFYIIDKEKLGINTIPESKEHKLAKNFIYDKIVKKELQVSYSQINKPYKYNNTINIFELPIDYEKVGIETTTSKIGNLTSRRADIIIPFIVKHPILGNGIVIEIQFSKQYNRSKISRELDWSIRGYSVAWLYNKDFEIIQDKHIHLKDIVRVDSFANLIKQNNKSFIRDLKFETQNLVRQLDEKKYEIQKEIQNKLYDNLNIKSTVQSIISEVRKELQPLCPKCNKLATLKNGPTNQFWGCSNYPFCKWTMNVLD